MIKAKHVISVSGGKDSTATLIHAIERGMPFQAVFADTGHENPVTVEYVGYLADRFNIIIRHVRADFSERIKRKREIVQTKWVAEGVDESIIQAALEALQPSGNPFLDLAIWKGRFPSTRAQFCTEHLKSNPIFEQIVKPHLAVRNVVSWTGERREESKRRQTLPKIQIIPFSDYGHNIIRVRPLVEKTAEWVFELHKKHEVKVNPLYKQGFSRVGCFPCIHARKSELRQIMKRYPEEVARLRRWEIIAGRASKRGQSTFFAAGTTPLSRDTGKIENSDEVFDWALTGRGGRQKDAFLLDGPQCQSEYGLCE